MNKTALIFLGLLSINATAHANGFVDWRCKYEWTQECDQQAMEEERFYRSQMLEQAKEQNRILEKNQRLQQQQLLEERQQREQEEMWRLMR
jgi:hypothetical protein